jgi:hypothetical protein
MSLLPTIDVVNEATTITDDEVAAIVTALQAQVHNDFRPVWNTPARIVRTHQVGAHSWGLVFLDDADQAGALGYHDLTAAGLPLGKVFVRTTQQDGGVVSITASHELLEMLADPWIDSAVQVADTTFWSLEVCDACEADRYGYTVNGVEVSDFVTPDWFRIGSPGPWDLRGHITRALELLPGGYIGEWTPNSGWSQKTADKSAPPSRRIPLRQAIFSNAATPIYSTRGDAG